MILRIVPGFSFCCVIDGSCLRDLIMLMFARPYMTLETSLAADFVPVPGGNAIS
jgi:hypothetical protein